MCSLQTHFTQNVTCSLFCGSASHIYRVDANSPILPCTIVSLAMIQAQIGGVLVPTCTKTHAEINTYKMYLYLYMKSSFPKDLNPLSIVLRKLPFFKITILHLINSDYFVVNERCHM